MSGTILIVEDDRFYRSGVVRYLRRLQYKVFEASDAEQALLCLDRHPVELVIMDIGLGKVEAFQGIRKPGKRTGCSGYALLDIIRSRPIYISIIVLTSLEETIYEVASLERGADDFVFKSIEREALAARVKVCLRRVRLLTSAAHHPPNPLKAAPTVAVVATDAPLRAGDFLIDDEHRLLRIADGPYLHLTGQETRLIGMMARNPGKVFRKQELLEAIWGLHSKQGYDSVDALVKQLRRKIEPNPKERCYLINAYGVGYRLNLIAREAAKNLTKGPREAVETKPSKAKGSRR